ncbi:MAG: hypothetical protein R3F56_05090 [Planctomycetota bacterium]
MRPSNYPVGDPVPAADNPTHGVASMSDEIKPRPILRVGIVGHTTVQDEAALRTAVAGFLEALCTAARACFASPTAAPLYRANSAPEFRFVSNLAPGADRIATEAALAAGFATTGILPVPRQDYESQLGAAQLAEFKSIADRPEMQILELPPVSSRYEEQVADSYALAARMLTDHVDVLIAAWAGPDGENARTTGPSLTRRVIDLARERNVPVAWIPIGVARAATTEPALPRHLADTLVAGRRWVDDPHCRQALADDLRALLDPYADAAPARPRRPWRRALEQLWHHVRGVEPAHLLHASDLAVAKRACLDAAEEALTPAAEPRWLHAFRAFMQRWAPFQRAMASAAAARATVLAAGRSPPGPPQSVLREVLPPLETRTGQLMGRYRASFSWIFALGACAVMLAVTAFLLKPVVPTVGKILAGIEVATVLTILVLHLSAHTQRWQQRALDLRLVIEILRQATWISRAWLVIPRPRLAGHLHAPGEPLSWSQWYAQAWLRDHHLGLDAKTRTRQVTMKDLRHVRHDVLAGLVVDQKRWYRSKWLDHRIFHDRMHSREVRLFLFVLAACFAALLLVFFTDKEQQHEGWFQVAMGLLVTVTAAFPAFAAASHGISAQAELHGIAQAYRRMTATLAARKAALRGLGRTFTLAELQRETAIASNLMLAEVQDWHHSYGVHPPPLT